MLDPKLATGGLPLDIRGAPLSDTDRIRICIDNIGMRAPAVGAGRVAFTGLPLDTSLNDGGCAHQHSVDTAEPGDTADDATTESMFRSVVLDRYPKPNTPWLETNWSKCEGTCEVCQSPGS